jgi:hypothetical protein
MRTVPSLQDATWCGIIRTIGAVVDLERSARDFKALQRVRKIRSAEALLRLALIWGPGGQSFRSAAALAQEGGIGDVSDKAVEGRLRRMGGWLAHILACLLAARLDRRVHPDGSDLRLSLVDGSVICSPGKGQDWRLHARYDPAQGRLTDLAVTTTREAEAVSRTTIGPDRLLVMDRGYARVRDFLAILNEGSDFITRLSWGSVRLFDATGARVDIQQVLRETTSLREVPVWIKGIERPLRLVIAPLPAEAAEQQRKRRRRKANRNSRSIDPRTEQAAGFMMLLTSLSTKRLPARGVLTRYDQRWQVEIAIKRLKTLGHLDRLPSSDPVLARTWLLAHLIAAVLTDDLAGRIIGFPPSAA